MIKLFNLFVAMIQGKLLANVNVDVRKFPFHAVYEQPSTNIRLETYRNSEGRVVRWLSSEQGPLPEYLSKYRLFKLMFSLAFKGSCKLRGGIQITLVSTKWSKISVLNVLLARFGYVMLPTNDHDGLKGVLHVLKNNNSNLKNEVEDLRQKVDHHEELLSDFCAMNAQHVVETEELRSNVKYTQEELDQTKANLANLKERTDRICDFLGIQSVDEFLLSAGPIQLPLTMRDSEEAS